VKLPCDLEAEKALLGAIIQDPRKLAITDQIIAPKCFYSANHQQIYEAAQSLYRAGQAVDLVTVYDELQKHKANLGTTYLVACVDACPSPETAGHYAKIIADKHTRRELYRVCMEGAQAAKNEAELDTGEAVAAVQQEIYNLSKQATKMKTENVYDLAGQRLDDYLDEEGAELKLVQTGFKDLDRLMDGFQKSEHIILAARPGMGKTSLACDIARNVAKQQYRVLFFTMEMSAPRLADRLICAEAMVNVKQFKRRELAEGEKEKIKQATGRLLNLPISIVDGSWGTSEIRAKVMQDAPDLVIVDFLTRINEPRRGNLSTHDHVGAISKRLQDMAIVTNVPIITCAQLSRGVERRENKRPILSDLRESGNIEENCDKVIFIYRDEYYNPNTKAQGIAEIIVAKYRDGPTGMVELAWLGAATTFRNLGRV